MFQKERLWDLVVIIIIALIIFIPSVCLFFIDGGQIRGINDDPATRPNLLGQNIDGLNFTPASGKIQPIYDDTEIIPLSLWQLSPREMLLMVITYPMAYIPLSTGKILSALYLASGLAFIILYRRKISRKDPDPNSRREQIRRYISEHPGRNTQQIADALSLPRSSLNYHLNRLQKTLDILPFTYDGQQRFLPANTGLTENQKILLSILSKEKDHLIFQTLIDQPSLTRKEIAAQLGISTTTAVWYIHRLERSHLLTAKKQERKLRYSLTPEIVMEYQKLAEIFTQTSEEHST
ncbi:winged helix-turn-helix transcriptional regulator [Methanorbis rubei]|uniref:HTH arsR-type domain-containing protein n=1 Tax=Methanorbis rubei TaxID=3028300 RepID=A0AAE4MGI2_9EURY|nr:hypothetical protein [Methanocorpusculaceae archaeon Cs1]